MSRPLKSIIIAAAVLVILCAALAVLLITSSEGKQTESGNFSDVNMSNILSFLGEDEDGMVIVTNIDTNSVAELVFTNEDGSYSLARFERDGNFFWNVDGLGGVAPDDDLIRRNVGYFAQLSGTEVARGVPSGELEHFGLDEPLASAQLKVDGGDDVVISFGMRNPANEQSIYCGLENGDVFLVDYPVVDAAFSDARVFAELTMTESDIKPERVVISRRDAEEKFELRYMSEYENVSDDITITTTNSYRFVEPIRAEVDAERASGLYNNLCGLQMYACEYLEKSDDNLIACGLDMPLAGVRFSCGDDEERLLLIGDEFTKETSANGTVQCYYAVLDGVEGIFSIEKRKAVWCTFGLFESVSKRPLSPYIYGCESVEIATADGELKFIIDEPNKRFLLDGEPVDSYGFRQLYSRLIGEVGDELYTDIALGDPILRVRFNYTEKYAAVYGVDHDELSYLDFDGRRYVVSFNGNTLFKVNGIYVQGIVDSVNELINN